MRQFAYLHKSLAEGSSAYEREAKRRLPNDRLELSTFAYKIQEGFCISTTL